MTDFPVVESVPALRARLKDFRNKGEKIALVPTMGALHDGHLSLVQEARRHAERVVVTIFVNPAQFGPSEDFAKYPRTLPSDLEKLASVQADLCFAPTMEAVYPPGFSTRVEVDGPARADLEDRFRPTHFCGVATVVAKLLNQAQADVAVFGEKDYQQLLVIQRLARDLDIATEILGAPTLREADGLAMSSRNVYLSKAERAAAPALYAALNEAARLIGAGEAIEATLARASAALGEAGFLPDYIEARHAKTLARIAGRRDGPIRLLAAARLGATRLIDNLAVTHEA
ncbi:pantoate--beta-alanine ligase [Methylocystis bryophila]|uniref:Pantothenate synthetase n=1 Tax=Methylocystis bryophila TaxID=655015 RepID=A0A1W6MWE7_9HYPH|nr:pantoate--beta-alanine ligase [Methylocystis bryophila]ARN81846.1 pantoate--beta-alanine ligase [Methylocystis bryophila]BDV37920.1 pantothenate synthetase 2 [Methylocystis bryophila]